MAYFVKVVKEEWGTNILNKTGVEQRFYVGNDGDVANVYGEEDVSEANILLSEGNMLSAGARIFRGPQGSKILVNLYLEFRTAHF